MQDILKQIILDIEKEVLTSEGFIDVKTYIDEIMGALPQWTTAADEMPEKEGHYLIQWPSGSINWVIKEEACRHCKCFKSMLWLGPLPFAAK